MRLRDLVALCLTLVPKTRFLTPSITNLDPELIHCENMVLKDEVMRELSSHCVQWYRAHVTWHVTSTTAQMSYSMELIHDLM